MTIEELVDHIISDFEKNKANGTNYIWRQIYDRALIENSPSQKARSVAFAETVLYGRCRQLKESPDNPDAKQETVALQVAIEHLRRLS